MTFDDGILTILTVSNMAEKGAKPVAGFTERAQHYYNYDNLGVTRYYQALQANQRLEAVVNIPDWPDITTDDACKLENGKTYRIRMLQPTYDEEGLKITKMSLERW